MVMANVIIFVVVVVNVVHEFFITSMKMGIIDSIMRKFLGNFIQLRQKKFGKGKFKKII